MESSIESWYYSVFFVILNDLFLLLKNKCTKLLNMMY